MTAEIPMEERDIKKEQKMISMTRLLDLAYEAATCLVPTEKLTEEQLEKLDNINCRLCKPNCPTCNEIRTRHRWASGQVFGHADHLTCYIGITHDLFRMIGGFDEHETIAPNFLLKLIATVLHEIIHVLFPEYTEDEVEDKTVEWAQSLDWGTVISLEKANPRTMP